LLGSSQIVQLQRGRDEAASASRTVAADAQGGDPCPSPIQIEGGTPTMSGNTIGNGGGTDLSGLSALNDQMTSQFAQINQEQAKFTEQMNVLKSENTTISQSAKQS